MNQQITGNPQQSPGLWLSLESLLNLPLDADSKKAIWQEALQQLGQRANANHSATAEATAAEAAAAERACALALQHALQLQELERVRALCLQGQWMDGLNRLEGLMAHTNFAADLAPLLLELLPELHHQLVDLPEQTPPVHPHEPEVRAELLWEAHRWLQRLSDKGISQPERMLVIHEQICRYGALAWMQATGSTAQMRRMHLLLDLLKIEPNAKDWALTAFQRDVCSTARDSQSVAESETSNSQLSTENIAATLHHCDNLIAIQEQLQTTPDPKLQKVVMEIKAGISIWERWLSPTTATSPTATSPTVSSPTVTSPGKQ